MSKTTRTRMSVDQRREQMLDAGVSLMAEKPVDDITVEDVIARAEISRALFYHYFSGKGDFYRQTVQRAADVLLDTTEPDAGETPLDQLTHSIDAYLEFAEKNATQYRAVYASLFSSDPEIRELLLRNQRNREQKIIEVLEQNGPLPPLARIAVHGWVSFMVACCLKWLETGEPSREEVRDFCCDMLFASVAAATT